MRVRDKVPPNSANTEECEVAEVQARYETTPKEADEYYLDEHGHLIVKHDLFNHDGLTQDGIAETFMEFAKKERLSFF
jgi:type I restriction enzyme M protein